MKTIHQNTGDRNVVNDRRFNPNHAIGCIPALKRHKFLIYAVFAAERAILLF